MKKFLLLLMMLCLLLPVAAGMAENVPVFSCKCGGNLAIPVKMW